MIGMQGMGIVRRDHKAVGQSLPVVHPQACANPRKGIQQEGGICALLGVGANLLVVKDAAHGNALALLGLEETLHGGPGALQVVQGPGREVLPFRAPDFGLLPVVQEQI